jgi:hypothetical protein
MLKWLLLFLPVFAFGQSWQNTGTATLQRQFVTGDTLWRNQVNNPSGFVYWYTKNQVNKLIPSGQQGQIIKASADNSRIYTASEPLITGNFVYTTDQLNRALAAGQATQLQIFNSFKRFSHGGSQTNPEGAENNNLVPGQPLQTNSWSYDTIAKRINSTFNTGSTIGLVSQNGYDNYIHTATMGSSVADNDIIGIVIAFMEDPTDLVPNNAYKLNPADFNWPIDVVDSLIPNQHALTLYRNRNGAVNSYFVAYDYEKLTQQTIIVGNTLPGLYNTTDNWSGNTVDVKVQRIGDTIKVWTSQFSDAPGGKGALAFPLTFTLTSNPVLEKFRGLHSYGFSSRSQAGAFWDNDVFSGSSNNIYDLSTNKVYKYNGTSYVLQTGQSVQSLLGLRYYWRNTTEQTFGYVAPDGSYDILNAPSDHTTLYGTASLNFPSTAANSSSTLNITVPGVVAGSPVSVGIPTSILPGGQNYNFLGVASGINTVSIVFFNNSSSSMDPTIGIFKVTVFQ